MDLELLKVKFAEYVSRYDMNVIEMCRKKEHSYRVMEAAKKIAMSEKLSRRQIEMAEVIGLVHDVGRFEQWMRYETFSDKKSVDHGELSVAILKETQMLEDVVPENLHELVFVAVFNHNKYAISDEINGEALLQSKLVRDADKLDIIYGVSEGIWHAKPGASEAVSRADLTPECLEDFLAGKQIADKLGHTAVDDLIRTFALIHDLNFKYTRREVLAKEYLWKILNRFEYKNAEIYEQLKQGLEQVISWYN